MLIGATTAGSGGLTARSRAGTPHRLELSRTLGSSSGRALDDEGASIDLPRGYGAYLTQVEKIEINADSETR